MNLIVKLSKLGEGTYGVVYKINYKDQDWALKKIRIFQDEDGIHYSVLRELNNYSIMTNHPHVLIPKGIFYDKKLHYLYDLYDNNLYQHLQDNVTTPEQHKKWAKQIALGLLHIHQQNIIHRDLKLENILIKDDNITLSDFGISKIMQQEMSPDVYTIWYRAPEIFQKRNYNMSTDIWALGCVFFELFSKGNVSLFNSMSELKILQDIMELLHRNNLEKFLKQNISESNDKSLIIDLLLKMIKYEPRYTIQEVLTHPLFGLKVENLPLKTEIDNFSFKPEKYLNKHPDLNSNMYHILFDWLILLVKSFGVSNHILLLSCDIFHMYMESQQNIERDKIQLVGTTALIIAEKLLSTKPVALIDYVCVCMEAYTTNDFYLMEEDICKSLIFSFGYPILNDFLGKVKSKYLDKFIEILHFTIIHRYELDYTNIKILQGALYLAMISLEKDSFYFDFEIDVALSIVKIAKKSKYDRFLKNLPD